MAGLAVVMLQRRLADRQDQDHAVSRPSEGNPQCPPLTINARHGSSSDAMSSALIDYAPALGQYNAK
jgi:hypothetical protein